MQVLEHLLPMSAGLDSNEGAIVDVDCGVQGSGSAKGHGKVFGTILVDMATGKHTIGCVEPVCDSPRFYVALNLLTIHSPAIIAKWVIFVKSILKQSITHLFRCGNKMYH